MPITPEIFSMKYRNNLKISHSINIFHYILESPASFGIYNLREFNKLIYVTNFAIPLYSVSN